MRRLDLAPYGAQVYMATTPAQWRALARKLRFIEAEAPEVAGRADFAYWQPAEGIGFPVSVVYINVEQHGGDIGQLVNTCAHEAAHVAAQLFDYIGHHPQGADEPSAYLVGALTQWLYEGVA